MNIQFGRHIRRDGAEERRNCRNSTLRCCRCSSLITSPIAAFRAANSDVVPRVVIGAPPGNPRRQGQQRPRAIQRRIWLFGSSCPHTKHDRLGWQIQIEPTRSDHFTLGASPATGQFDPYRMLAEHRRFTIREAPAHGLHDNEATLRARRTGAMTLVARRAPCRSLDSSPRAWPHARRPYRR